jgi:putative ABC transport system permease protein
MQELFGIPMGPLAAVLAVALAVVIGAVAALALRNRVFFKLGVRNVRRRRARTALIVGGLMLGTTIIASALASGDTMSHTIRSAAIESLGATDEIVSAQGAEIDFGRDTMVSLGEATGVDYFSEDLVPTITHELLRSDRFDGVAPAIIEPVAVQNVTKRQNEPRVTLFASSGPHLAAFGDIRTVRGQVVSLDDLSPGQIYLNEDAATDLAAHRGDTVRLLAGKRSMTARVRAVVRFDGTGTDGAALLVGLPAAQELLGRPGEVKHVLISNVGDPTSGVRYTDEISNLLEPTLTRLRLDIDPVKRDALEAADAEGNAFMSLFTTFGSFSIFAGFLLIFLIFVMLAAERRGELGIARAVGTQRRHLIQMYLYEGLAYDLLAAAVGAAIGVAVAFGMVFVLSSALGATGISIEHDVQLRSIVVAYALGVLLTFVIVALSAWRVSRLNIVTAVRNLPDPPKVHRRRAWIGAFATTVIGALLIAAAITSGDALPFLVGVPLVLVGAVPVARALGVPERIAYTVSGVGIVVFSLLPFSWYDRLAGTDLAMSFSVWVASGLLLVVGAAWVIVYNADLLLGTAAAVVGRIRSLAPVLRLSIAYPLRNRFRTGITLAMFTLVVFTLVVGTVLSSSFIRFFDDVEAFGGGWDVRAGAAAVSPIDDPARAVAADPTLRPQDYRAVSAQSFLTAEARQAGRYPGEFASYPVIGVDDVYAKRTTYGFSATAQGYPDPWRALAQEPGLAVVDGIVAPRRDNWNAGMVLPEFTLRGFYVDDGAFDPVPVVVRDPQTGRELRLKVIGVLSDSASGNVQGIVTSQESVSAAFGGRVRPTVYYFDLAPGVDPRAEARKLESAFIANGVEADALEEILEDGIGAQRTFNRLIQGFMGLGLVVGVAALGVISARAVVERRQQIGILRAIGLRRRMIQVSFLLESSFIALTAIVVGTVFGLIASLNVIGDVTSTNASMANLSLAVPWLSLALVFVVVYAVALATTLAPAVRASRIYPAEALRYE